MKNFYQYVLKTVIVIMLIATVLEIKSCFDQINAIKGSNIVGSWHHHISKYVGDYQISQITKLRIDKNESGEFVYKLETIVRDAMYGSQPKTKYSNGSLEDNSQNHKWHFRNGEFGNRGGYIYVPDDKWNDYRPDDITIGFRKNRGNSMTFTRND